MDTTDTPPPAVQLDPFAEAGSWMLRMTDSEVHLFLGWMMGEAQLRNRDVLTSIREFDTECLLPFRERKAARGAALEVPDDEL